MYYAIHSLRCRSSNGDCRYGQLALSLSRELKDTPENQLDRECNWVKKIDTTCTIRGIVMSLSFFLPIRRRIEEKNKRFPFGMGLA